MREFIYAIVVVNVIIGFVLIYRKPRPFRGKSIDVKDARKNNRKTMF